MLKLNTVSVLMASLVAINSALATLPENLVTATAPSRDDGQATQTACPETGYVVYPEASHVIYPHGTCVFDRQFDHVLQPAGETHYGARGGPGDNASRFTIPR
jgi:hypothetical protein